MGYPASIRRYSVRKAILRMYGLAAILFVSLFVYGLLNLRLSATRAEALSGMEMVNDFTVNEVQDETAPRGKRFLMAFRLDGIHEDYDSIIFLSMYENIKAYLNNECIYSLEPESGFLIPESPGYVYNIIRCSEADNGKQFRIEVTPVYWGEERLPEIMIGSSYEIVKTVIYANLPILFLCVTTIFVGIAMLIGAVMDRAGLYQVEVAILPSLFVFLVAFWKLLNSDLAALFTSRFPVLTLFPYFALMLMPILLVEFIRTLSGVKRTLLWVIPQLVTMVSIVIVLVLQALDILDIHESMWTTQLSLIICIICIGLALREAVREYDWTRKLKQGVIACVAAVLWLVIDIFTYYGTKGVTSFPVSMLVFLIFILILVCDGIRQSRKGMEVGMQARQYKKLAYHDALTGFFNRAAYIDYLSANAEEAKNNVFLAFDLNNLKKCNDELGHDKGDFYIKEAARILMDCFGDRGKCYRLGGDEFGAILENSTLSDCIQRVDTMKAMVDRFNRHSTDIHMGIACGYAIYDASEDHDIHETIRRADKMMYEVKFRMKQQENSL